MNIAGFRCVQCQSKLVIPNHGLCSRCNKKIRCFSYCGRCGTELPRDALYCGKCLQVEPIWDRMVIIGHYTEPLSTLIHQFKFQKQFFLDRTLARLLLLAIYQAKRTHQLILPEVILPVPLHHKRQWQRGYNQADLVAQYLSHWLKIKCDNQWLHRCRHTHTQRGLSAAARQKNLRNAFALSNIRSYQSVALVDDVITTGSTLNEISRLLRKNGVQHIQVWGLARV